MEVGREIVAHRRANVGHSEEGVAKTLALAVQYVKFNAVFLCNFLDGFNVFFVYFHVIAFITFFECIKTTRRNFENPQGLEAIQVLSPVRSSCAG